MSTVIELRNKAANLAKELSLVNKAIDAELERLQNERSAFIVNNVEAFLAITPEHTIDDCSDTNVANCGYVKCLRCALLYIKRFGIMYDSFDIIIEMKEL